MRAQQPTVRLLRPFAHVRRGEAMQAVLMLLCVFLIMTSYYLMKTAREALILTSGKRIPGQELKAYAGGVMAVLLVALVPAYDALAARVRRLHLLEISYAIVIGCLCLFYFLFERGVPIGLAFFVWIGVVGVFLVAQFWSYANDLYTEEQGERLFAVIAVGGSLGAVLGPGLATQVDTHALMPLAITLLTGTLVLFRMVEHMHQRAAARHPAAAVMHDEPLDGAGGFSLVRHDRYLTLIAALVLIGTLVNTMGEFVLSSVATNHAQQLVPATAHADLVGAAREAAIKADRREVIESFYGHFFFLVNLTGFLIQAFVVSRAIRVLGVRRALFVMPLIALGAYGAMGTIGGLALVRAAKVAENGTDYSLESTVRQLLFLPTDREVKYKAKAAIDTFVVRTGDAVAAVVIFGGVHLLGLDGRAFALLNVGLVAVWLAVAVGIVRHRKRYEVA